MWVHLSIPMALQQSLRRTAHDRQPLVKDDYQIQVMLSNKIAILLPRDRIFRGLPLLWMLFTNVVNPQVLLRMHFLNACGNVRSTREKVC